MEFKITKKDFLEGLSQTQGVVEKKNTMPVLSNVLLEAEKQGLKIPERMYLCLGDNHAGSSDCRDFGLVPEDLIQGTASFLVWPPTSHWGRTQGIKPPFISLPNCLIWSLGLSIFAWAYFSHKKEKRKLKDMGL